LVKKQYFGKAKILICVPYGKASPTSAFIIRIHLRLKKAFANHH